MSASNSKVPAQQLRDWDNAHVWHPFTAMSAYVDEHAPIIADAEGFDLIDVDGRKYLDGISSLWCNVHGHRVPEIDDAVRAQLDRVGHSTMLGLSSEVSIRLAKAIVDITPVNLTRVFYSDSGATAVEVALKLAYQYHQQKSDPEVARDTFISVGNAYHGDTLGSVSVGSMDVFHRVYRHLLFPTVSVPSPVATRVPEGHDRDSWLQYCFDRATELIKENHQRAAGFVIEPLVQGAAGILVHPSGYLKHIRTLCTRYSIPLIADEVAVGLGRTGTMFACEQEAVLPDLMCVAKGITGGYLPLAATLATEEIYEAFLGAPDAGRTFFHGHTYTGNPLGCAAALASLQRFQEHNLLENVSAASKLISERLSNLATHPHVGEIRQKGIMVGIELVRDRQTMDPFASALRVGHQVTVAARKRGVIIRPLGDVVVLMPAPAMPLSLVERLCDITMEAIQEVVSQPE
ncbi:MAG: adenosylmethionine--8-amino-7-oxononanoate transaminase [Fuerstiella sp.]|nr:adenosylmethionine--8-amino-7-oxononanoate transaminase [Fuerstiella sp.]MCP4859546.1 adenosylmethionine--8-amino-7-oxononanoate transaminase [Fuerstiella sp.]